ncbi:hypothetical protein BP6252_05212 [Coleophoma cylindrospora]|uniref:beta-glucosidase n=1 Tax=Coleophoma cylindrospora TaxID=1849047 RepID=A0A3D8RSZ4_9HELO|nr:hypothetical protein BP6252_05212 [Coleophoma cylindrospora]
MAEMLPYRDASLSIDERVEDLLSRMTLAEKSGQLFHNMISMGPQGELSSGDAAYRIPSTAELVQSRLMTHFNLVGAINDARLAAEWYNRLQQLALSTRLGIPITLSTDPRNHFEDNVGTSSRAGVFSQWPEPLGFAALRSSELAHHFADISRQEYLAVGIRCALHPQVDLATEPRWARINQTFGEDADLSSTLVQAYIHGFQGDSLGKESVSAMTKHFPGGGAQMDGEDAHFTYGREQVYPGNNFEYHLKPFIAAIEAGTSQMMPYYGMPVGTEYEEVGFAFNKGIIQGILRDRLGFQGIICTDWGLITDAIILGQDMPARAWGCEDLSELQRAKKILDAGCDQFGGESRPDLVIQLVESGQLPESRIDQSVRRILHQKFQQGLFDSPFVDVDAAAKIVGRDSFRAEGIATQSRSFTLLKNDNAILPIRISDEPLKLYLEGLSLDLLKARLSKSNIELVSNPSDADLALLRLRCPYEPRPGGFEKKFHAGSLAYSPSEVSRLQTIFSSCPTIIDVYLDRPAVIPEIAANCTALLVNYGAEVSAFIDVVFGKASPEGKLPFDLPRSMDAVKASRSDVPYDTADAVFKFGDGLRYA